MKTKKEASYTFMCGSFYVWLSFLTISGIHFYRLGHQSTFTPSNLNKSISDLTTSFYVTMIGECSYPKRKSVKMTKTVYINNVPWKIFSRHFRFTRTYLLEKNSRSHHIKSFDGCEWRFSISQCSISIDLKNVLANLQYC